MSGTEIMCIALTVINGVITVINNRQHLSKVVEVMSQLQGKYGNGGVMFKDVGGDVTVSGDVAGRDKKDSSG